MKADTYYRYRGTSLIEAVIAIGVLAVAIPLTLAMIAGAGKSGLSSKAESRCTWIVPACLEEIRASREGRSQYFTATSKGDIFPPPGDVWTLAFGPDGKVVGKISRTVFQNGAKESDGKSIHYFASMSANAAPVNADETPMMNVQISIAYPASAPAKRREILDFYTRIP